MSSPNARPPRTALNVIIVSAASLIQVVNQLLFFKVNTYFHGATEATDPLFFALNLSTVVNAVVTGAIAYVLVPELVSKFGDQDQRKAWELAAFVGMLTGVVCGILAMVLYAYASPLCGWLLEEKVAGQVSSAAKYLRVFCLNLVFMGLISWAQAVLHSRHQFFYAALGGVLGTALQLVFLLLAGKTVAMIAWAIVLGSGISLAIHLIPLLRYLRFPRADWSNLSRLLASFWPLLLGAAFLRLDPLINQVWASELDEGTLSRLHYAFRIMMALLTIGTSSLSLVAFPQLSQEYAALGKPGFRDHFALCLRRMVLIIQPVVVGVSCFSVWIISDLLESPGGMFTRYDSSAVGWLVALLMGMFIGASLAELFSRGFYVLNDTKTPTLIGVLCLLVGLLIKFGLFKVWGIWGIAVGVSFYYLLTAGVLAWVLARRVGFEIFGGVLYHFSQATTAALIACLGCYFVYAYKLGATFVAAPVGVIGYFGALLLLRNDEAWQLINGIKSKWLNR